MEITVREEGSCFSGSAAIAARAAAWRCGVQNGILGPCFTEPILIPGDTGILYCAEEPFSSNVVELTSTEPLPEEGGNEAVSLAASDQAGILPRALELTNGEHCTLLTGATTPIGGLRLTFCCESGASVFGDIDRSEPMRVVNYLADDAYTTDLVGVEAVWT